MEGSTQHTLAPGTPLPPVCCGVNVPLTAGDSLTEVEIVQLPALHEEVEVAIVMSGPEQLARTLARQHGAGFIHSFNGPCTHKTVSERGALRRVRQRGAGKNFLHEWIAGIVACLENAALMLAELITPSSVFKCVNYYVVLRSK